MKIPTLILTILFVLLVQLCSCTSKTKQKAIQKDKQVFTETSHYYKNGQKAFEKVGDTIFFYDYTGKKTSEVNLVTCIEKRYDGKKISEYNTTPTVQISKEHFALIGGYIIEKGTTSPEPFSETGSVISIVEDTIFFDKNKFGYSTEYQFNNYGKVFKEEGGIKKYDNLGRVCTEIRCWFSCEENKIYKKAVHTYSANGIAKTEQWCLDRDRNYTENYQVNKEGFITNSIKTRSDTIMGFTHYTYDKGLLKVKTNFKNNNNYVIINQDFYDYNDNNECVTHDYARISLRRYLGEGMTNYSDFLKHMIPNYSPIDIRGHKYTIEEKETYTYNEKGQVIELKTEYKQRNKETRTVYTCYTYNEKGQLIAKQRNNTIQRYVYK